MTVYPKRPGIFTEPLSTKAGFGSYFWGGMSPAIWGIEATATGNVVIVINDNVDDNSSSNNNNNRIVFQSKADHSRVFI